MQEIRTQLSEDLTAATTGQDIEAVRVRYLGRKGAITLLRKNADFSAMSADERKRFGQQFNELKRFAEQQIAAAQARQTSTALAPPSIDMTLPGLNNHLGHLHPISLVQLELEEIFQSLGFMILDGYHVETDFYNFESLNIPPRPPCARHAGYVLAQEWLAPPDAYFRQSGPGLGTLWRTGAGRLSGPLFSE